MSSRLRWWAALIAVNAAIWLYFLKERTQAKATASEEEARTAQPTAQPPSKAAPVVVVRTNAFQWGQLESEDYHTYIQRLRTIGCPEETIRDIVIADLDKLIAPEFKAVEGQKQPPKYWEPKAVLRTVESLEKLTKKDEIDFRKREIVRELLGIDLAAERSRTRGESDFYADRLGFVTPDKQMRVRIAMEKANREENLLREKSWLENDELTAEERRQLHEIQKHKEEEIAQVLAPNEMDQYNLWFSPSAYKVRDAFLALEPNEQDFLALYQIQRQFDQKWEGTDVNALGATEKLQYQKDQKDYLDQIRTQLGNEKYEIFLESREPDFLQLQDTIAQFGLKPDTAGQIYSFKKALLDERTQIAANQAMPAEHKREILQALSDETQQAVVEVMGPKAYRYYMRSGAGKWISE